MSFGLAGCGEGEDTQVPQPTGLTYTFSFGTPSQALQAYSFWLEDAREGVTNQIAISVLADFDSACLVHKIRGSITFDPAVLEAVNYTEGPYLQQDGVDTDTGITFGTNRVTFRIDRPISASGVAGRGTVITFRFRPAGSVTRGATSPLEWADPHAYTVNFHECLHATRGGEVSVR